MTYESVGLNFLFRRGHLPSPTQSNISGELILGECFPTAGLIKIIKVPLHVYLGIHFGRVHGTVYRSVQITQV